MSVLTLAEAKAHLNITTSTNDAEIQDLIDAAEATIAKRVGPLTPTTITSVVSGNGYGLVLPVTPVISVTSASATYWGTSTTVTTLDVDPGSGVVRFYPTTPGLSGGVAGSPYVDATYTVTYLAGRSTVPDDLLYAVKEMVRHLWRTQRGPQARPGQPVTDNPAPSYLIPYAVAELLEPHMQIGFA